MKEPEDKEKCLKKMYAEGRLKSEIAKGIIKNIGEINSVM